MLELGFDRLRVEDGEHRRVPEMVLGPDDRDLGMIRVEPRGDLRIGADEDAPDPRREHVHRP